MKGKSKAGTKRFVYIVKCESYIKVGVSDKPFSRISTMETGNPFDLELVALLFVNGKRQAYATEHNIHKKFANDRVKGEWFNDSILDDVLEMMVTPITDKAIMKKHCQTADDYNTFNNEVDIDYAYDMGYRSGFVRRSTKNPFKGVDTLKAREWSKGRKVGMTEFAEKTG
jgi:hypothetical protein